MPSNQSLVARTLPTSRAAAGWENSSLGSIARNSSAAPSSADPQSSERQARPAAGSQACETVTHRPMPQKAIPITPALCGSKDATSSNPSGYLPDGDKQTTQKPRSLLPTPAHPEIRPRCPPLPPDTPESTPVPRRTWPPRPTHPEKDSVADPVAPPLCPRRTGPDLCLACKSAPAARDHPRQPSPRPKPAHHRPRSRPSATLILPSLPAPLRERETARATPAARLRWSCIPDTDRCETTPRRDPSRLLCESLRPRSWTKQSSAHPQPLQFPAHSHPPPQARRNSARTIHTFRQSSTRPCVSTPASASDLIGLSRQFGEDCAESADKPILGRSRYGKPNDLRTHGQMALGRPLLQDACLGRACLCTRQSLIQQPAS